MVWVLPGWEDILANPLRFISVLMREDFPTLDLPQKASSILSFCGSLLVIPQTVSNSSDRMTITFSFSLARRREFAPSSQHIVSC